MPLRRCVYRQGVTGPDCTELTGDSYYAIVTCFLVLWAPDTRLANPAPAFWEACAPLVRRIALLATLVYALKILFTVLWLQTTRAKLTKSGARLRASYALTTQAFGVVALFSNLISYGVELLQVFGVIRRVDTCLPAPPCRMAARRLSGASRETRSDAAPWRGACACRGTTGGAR